MNVNSTYYICSNCNGSGIGGMWQTGDLNDVDNFDYSLKNDLNYMMPESRFFQLKQLD